MRRFESYAEAVGFVSGTITFIPEPDIFSRIETQNDKV